MVIPAQITDELKELGAEHTPTTELVPLPTQLPAIFIEPTIAPLKAIVTPMATISDGRRRLLEQMRGGKP
jgi:hypothetical protein